MTLRSAGAALLIATTACSGQPLSSGLTEPIAVHDAQFISGSLPGTVAPAGDNPKLVSPTTTLSDYPVLGVKAGQSDISFSGHASHQGNPVAIGVQLKDAGSGYWLLPLGSPDPANQNDLQWNDLTIDFSIGAPVGARDLLFDAIDANGHGGTQADVPFCIDSAIPDNRNACAPARQPPALVVGLSWNTPVDLDLKVILPGGSVIDAKHPSFPAKGGPQPGGDGTIPPGPDTTGAYIDTDSNANCVIDGVQRENLVYWQKPPAGTYVVYADLFDACGQSSVSFTVTPYVSRAGKPQADGTPTFKVVALQSTSGTLVAQNADQGTALGTFVTELKE